MSGDPDLKRMLKEVFAEDDRLRAESEASDRRIEQLQEQARENRRQRGEVVHKTFDPAERQPQQQRVADLSAEAQSRWDTWADQRADLRIKEVLKKQFYRGNKPGEIDDLFLKTDHMKKGYREYRAKEPAFLRSTVASYGDVVDQSWEAAEQLGIVRRAHDEKIAALEKAVEDLQQKVGALNADLEIERAAKVIDLPNPLRQRHAG